MTESITPESPVKRKRAIGTTLWVSTTYFAEGLPYMIVRFMSSVFFTDMGVREAYLGFLNFFGIPWNLKFIWAPFLDLFGTKRGWMLKIQLAISLLTLVIAVLAGLKGNGQITSTGILMAIAFVFIALAFISATNDVAIDAYYLEGLTDKREQAAYSGLRIMVYRIAVIYARSVLVAIAGVANWCYGFGAGAATMFVVFLFHKFYLPKFEAKREGPRRSPKEIASGFVESFRTYLKQDKIFLAMIFVITYKLGDEILFSMNTPFLMRELLVTKTQLAWLAGIVGIVATVVGSLLGAWWIKRTGLKKAIWPLTLLMNVNIWAYVALAVFRPQATDMNGLVAIAAVHAYEMMAAGLGNAVLTVYLMRLCSPRFKAAHYAIGTAIMSLGSTFFGGFGGLIVEWMGYVQLFILGFVAALPSMLILFWLPLQDEEPAK